MSDLAPFVAAVIRDQVVSELVEERRRLEPKVQLLVSASAQQNAGLGHRIDIYASALFADGRRSKHEDGRFWKVQFATTSACSNKVPISQLINLQLIVSGVLLAQLDRDSSDGFASLDSQTERVRYIEVQTRNAWVVFDIDEGVLPEESLTLLLNSTPERLWETLTGPVAQATPDAPLGIFYVEIEQRSVPGLGRALVGSGAAGL